MNKWTAYLVGFLMIFTVSCENTATGNDDLVDTKTEEIAVLQLKLNESEKEIILLSEKLKEHEAELAKRQADLLDKEKELEELKRKLFEYSIMEDRAVMTFDNLKLLEPVVDEFADHLPLLNHQDEWSKEVLQSIDFNSEKMKLSENEYLLYATALQEGDENTAYVECTLYRSYDELGEVSYFRTISFQAVKMDGQWVVDEYL